MNATAPARFVEIADYRHLKDYGFSAQKAAEIVLDANRGDQYALAFVKLARASATEATPVDGVVK